MPTRAAQPTYYTMRATEIGKRIHRVVNKLPVKQGLRSNYGIFATRVHEIAKENNLPWHKGHNKDATTSVRSYAEGTALPFSKYFDALERTCAAFEEDFRVEREKVREAQRLMGQESERVNVIHFDRDVTELFVPPNELESVTKQYVEDNVISMDRAEAGIVGRGFINMVPGIEVQEEDGDIEVRAIHCVVGIFESLGVAQRVRVGRYINERFNIPNTVY